VRGAAPLDTGDFTGDCARYSPFWQASATLLSRLPAKPARNAEETYGAEHVKRVAREARTRFSFFPRGRGLRPADAQPARVRAWSNN